MKEEFTGGCACGAIRYKCSEKPVAQLICHCRDCQRASGSATAASVLVASDRITFEGAEQKYHTVTTDSGNRLSRGFCPTCGSPVSARWEGNPMYARLGAIAAGSLDDPSWFLPTFEDWTSRAYAWHSYLPDTLKFAERPTPEAFRNQVEAYFEARRIAND
jgi:hypothetical protein